MRASFVFSEVITGLRRNVTMTVAMILTTAISLGLLGGGLLIVRTIDKISASVAVAGIADSFASIPISAAVFSLLRT